MAATPVNGICYTAYDAESYTWLGPPGAGMLVSRELEQRLNFTTQMVYSHNSFGNQITKHDAKTGQNVTYWDGMIGKLVTGEADWSPCYLTRTLKRAAVVDFSPTAFYISETLAVLRVPTGRDVGQSLRYDSVLQPFDASMWLLVGLSIAFYTLLLAVINTVMRQSQGLARELITQHIRLMCTLCNISYASSTVMDESVMCRIIWTFWSLSALIIHWLYGGELRSYFTSSDRLDLITSWSALCDRFITNQLTLTLYDRGNFVRKIKHMLPHARYVEKLSYCSSVADCYKHIASPSDDGDRLQAYLHDSHHLQLECS